MVSEQQYMAWFAKGYYGFALQANKHNCRQLSLQGHRLSALMPD